MAAEFITNALVSTFVETTIDNLASRFGDIFRGKKANKEQLTNLKLKLLALDVVTDDAEQKQFTDPRVRGWLLSAKSLVIDAEDLLDEIHNALSKSQVEAQSQGAIKKVFNSLKSSFVSFFEENEIETRIEQIIAVLEDLENRSHVLDLKKTDDVGVRSGSRLSSTSLPNESDIYGREHDKQFVFNWLTSDTHNNLSILSIVGMGGVGKTTLAQHVFNDPRMDETKFDVKAWVCVSDEFDVFKVSKAILEHVTKPTDDDTRDLEMVHRRLKKELKGKKFFLVLDDVWNENQPKWEEVRKPLVFGAQGSRILVTTRSKEVASTMRSEEHSLEKLQENDCWKLFAKHAFQDDDTQPNQECREIGMKIVKKCKGLPLALKTMGSMLYNKSSVSEWQTVFQSEIWEFSKERCDIIPALALSYIHLPSHLKVCFAYCALFPKDYEFVKEDLIQLWMTENQCREHRTPEEVCLQYFNDLLSRSFFQQSHEKSHEYKEVFFMHDLLHDLAKYVGGGLYFTCELDQTEKMQKVTRHFSFSFGYSRCSDGFGTLCNAESLRTFVSIHRFFWRIKMSIHELFSKFKFIRILSLSHCFVLQELPDSVANLEHLRSLDLSNTDIKRLNEKICLLSHLQILKLNYCKVLKQLPSNLYLLINLCRLEFKGTKVTKVPPYLGKLKNLKIVMGSFNVGHDRELGIQRLRELNLEGSLIIQGLQNVENSLDALEADLQNKTHLVALKLAWESDQNSNDSNDRNSNDSKKEEEVIENLQPSKNLKKLSICRYGGKRFPNWLLENSLWNMTSVVLEECKSCERLPPLGLLPFLKFLRIRNLDGIMTIDGDFYGSNSCSFKSLETLDFLFLSRWEKWDCQAVGAFPRLRRLHIAYCKKLKGQLPEQLNPLETLRIIYCPQLQTSAPRALDLELYHYGELQLEWGPMKRLTVDSIYDDWLSLRSFPLDLCPTLKMLNLSKIGNLEMISQSLIHNHLEELTLNSCPKFESLPGSMHLLLPSLRELSIRQCPGLQAFPDGGLPSNLQNLTIQGCLVLESFPNEGWPSNLQTLVIEDCPKLKSFSDRGFSSNLQTLKIQGCLVLESFLDEGLPSNLQTLVIEHCPRLKSFPDRGLPSNLQTLTIQGCLVLESFPDEGWPSNLQTLVIEDCPKLKPLPDRDFPSNLQTLKIEGCLVPESFPGEGLSSNLQTITIKDCPRLKLFPHRSLPLNLQTLTIKGCSVLESFSDEGFPQNLQTLEIKDCPRLKSFPGGGLPSNLKNLTISNCSRLVGSLKGAFTDSSSLEWLWIKKVDIKCFPNEGLLPLSLTYLSISDCPNLEKLDSKGLHQLSSLQILYLKNCPNLQRLPEEGLPKSISELDISYCPLLQTSCQKDGGEEWKKIIDDCIKDVSDSDE